MTGHELLNLVRGADDSAEHLDAIEGARDHVRRDLLPMLAAAYPTLDWRQRCTLVLLVQDHIDRVTRSMMQDFLSHAPRQHSGDPEAYQVARAIALCHLEGSFDAFPDYIAHPEIVERRARDGGA